MSDNSGQNDPSMKEILGSIRRIISEDNAQPGAAGAAEGGEEEEVLDLTEEVAPEDRQEPTLVATGTRMPDETDEPEIRREPVLGLHRPVEPETAAEQPAPPAQEYPEADQQEAPVLQDTQQSTPIPAEMMQDTESPLAEASADAGPAVDQEAVEEVAAPLAPAVSEESVKEIVSESATTATATALGELTRAMDEKTNKLKVGPGEVSIADMVKELIRPMLREWLDENLPGIVERVVRREIQKLVDRAEPED
jgi:cell pole-organizing protein PopZ